MCDWGSAGRVASVGPAEAEMSAPDYHKNILKRKKKKGGGGLSVLVWTRVTGLVGSLPTSLMAR